MRHNLTSMHGTAEEPSCEAEYMSLLQTTA